MALAALQPVVYHSPDNTNDPKVSSDHEQCVNSIQYSGRIVRPIKFENGRRVQQQNSALLPNGAVDTHVHVFDPDLGPYSPNRAYTPANARLAELLSFIASLAASRTPPKFVLVQPSPYGTDNTVLMASLEALHVANQFARGIAVVDVDTITDNELWHMHSLGVRGLRLNMQAHGAEVNVSRLKLHMKAAAARIQHLPGWKLQLFVPAWIWTELCPTVLDLPVCIIADHTGGLLAPSKLVQDQCQSPTLQPGYAALIALARARRVIIKISALYRSSSDTETAYADMEPLIRGLVQEVPDSLIWASDWPHTGEGKDRVAGKRDLDKLEPFRHIDDQEVLRNLRAWVGHDDRAWKMLMVDNPERTFA